jgi:hypothetical protein
MWSRLTADSSVTDLNKAAQICLQRLPGSCTVEEYRERYMAALFRPDRKGRLYLYEAPGLSIVLGLKWGYARELPYIFIAMGYPFSIENLTNTIVAIAQKLKQIMAALEIREMYGSQELIDDYENSIFAAVPKSTFVGLIVSGMASQGLVFTKNDEFGEIQIDWPEVE